MTDRRESNPQGQSPAPVTGAAYTVPPRPSTPVYSVVGDYGDPTIVRHEDPTIVRHEERRNDDGTLDEVLLYVDGRCVFHLEQMDKSHWYFGLYPSEAESEQYWVRAKSRVSIANYADKDR